MNISIRGYDWVHYYFKLNYCCTGNNVYFELTILTPLKNSLACSQINTKSNLIVFKICKVKKIQYRLADNAVP